MKARLTIAFRRCAGGARGNRAIEIVWRLSFRINARDFRA
jgi:hypothetical protein